MNSWVNVLNSAVACLDCLLLLGKKKQKTTKNFE